jgi:hypothetical protein
LGLEIFIRRFFAYDSVMEIRGLPTAWVVKCRKCGCIVTCRATDPQADHAQPDKAEPAPTQPLIVTCSCCWSAFRYEAEAMFKGSPAPNASCEQYRKASSKNNNALFLAASLIAAVRLNREEIKPSPAVQSKIADSVRLAEMVHKHIERN